MAVAVAALCVLVPIASAQATSPRATLLQQATLLKQARWPAMYRTFTAQFRRSCPYATFVARQRATRRVLGTSFELRAIRVRLETPTRAVVAYSFVRNGQTLGRVTLAHRDVYSRVGGRWYDELDRVSSC
ncbi:MAG: hypothetical protein M3310_03120 [Actinomycetota bacterium]|nr:hypothetical protein [Actinomycetota bacterium]